MHLTSHEIFITYQHRLRTFYNEIRASSFNACWAKRFRNGSLSMKFLCSFTPFSERKWPLRAHKHVLSRGPRTGTLGQQVPIAKSLDLLGNCTAFRREVLVIRLGLQYCIIVVVLITD